VSGRDVGAFFQEIGRLAADVRGRLEALGEGPPAVRALARSLAGDLRRHAAERERLSRRLLPAPVAEPMARRADADLDALHQAQEALMLAYADGLTVLPDGGAVRVMAGHMADVSRHLTIVDLWRADLG
jgi:hypothetical protein